MTDRQANTTDRALQFLRRSLELTADSVQEVEGGWVMRAPSLPQVWNLNHLLLAAPVPWHRALAIADEHLADLAYRHIVAEHELGSELHEPLRAQGFKVEREVVMTMAHGSDQRAAGRREPDVIEPDEWATLELMRRWNEEDERVGSAVEQLLEATLREGRAWGERRFGIAAEDGKLAAITKLRGDGHTAQVEDVYTAPEARGRGFARALVAHAVRIAQQGGHDAIFIIADDNDWPKHFYARLGFRPVALRWAFHRELTRSGAATHSARAVAP